MRLLDNCPACQHDTVKVVATLDAQKRARFLEFDQRKYGGLLQTWLDRVEPMVTGCPRCGHCWYRVQPSPEQLMQMYAAARPFSAASENPDAGASARRLQEMTRLRAVVGRERAKPTLLDYGSGHGRWTVAAAKAGFRVTAFEPSTERSESTQPGFELVHDLKALRGRRFDAIQLEQVLEHVSDPLQTLRGLRDLCSSTTVIRVTVPNLLRAQEGSEVWQRWPYDGSSPHILAPFEHLHAFTPRSLRLLVRLAGFRPLLGLRVWRYYPDQRLRRLLGAVSPSLDTTFQLIRVGDA
jgi:hypothetical protein